MEKILKNKKKILLVASVVLVIIIAIIINHAGPSKKADLSNTNQNDPISMVDLAKKMESNLGLQNVMISEVVGGILEVRVNTPKNVSKENLDIGTAYIFGYLEPNINKDTEKIRVIYTNNYLDVTLYEASFSDISDWVSKKIDDTTFAKKIKFVNLINK